MKFFLNKRFISIFFILLFFFSYASFALAAFEVSDYPKIPGLPELTKNSDLSDYVGYIFGAITYMAGVIAVISFAVGAVQLILSASSPALAGEAKDRMKGSILGLVLTLVAVVILRTINPNIVNTTITALPGVDGVYYTNGQSDKSAPQSADTSTIPEGYTTLIYRCSNSNIAPALLVWVFTNKSLDYSGGATTFKITCGGTVSLSSAGSFKTAYEAPGVYYCMDGCSGNMCKGYMSEANLSSQDEIGSPFKGNIKGVRIVNNTVDPTEYYGAIFHKEIGLENGGECTVPIVSTKNESCQNINVSAFSADIFKWNKNDPDSSGDGITFYSEPYGWDADVQSGETDITKEEIKNAGNNIFTEDSDLIEFDYSYVESEAALFCDGDYPSCKSTSKKDETNVTQGKCCPCTNLKECQGSVQIKGDYIVGLYSYLLDENNKKTNRLYCQTFIDDVETLYAYKYIQPGGELEYINIIPIKY